MAIMTVQQRQEVWASFMREVTEGEVFAITKLDLRAAVDALDQWLSDNAASANTVIPQPARAALSAPQKARLLTAIIRQRYLTGV